MNWFKENICEMVIVFTITTAVFGLLVVWAHCRYTKAHVVHTRKLVQLRLGNNQTISGSVFLFMGSVRGQTELRYSAYIETDDSGKILFSAPADVCTIYEDGKNYVQFKVCENGFFDVKFHIPENSIARSIDVNIPGAGE